MPFPGTMHGLAATARYLEIEISLVDWMAGIGLRWVYARSIIETVHVTSLYYGRLKSLLERRQRKVKGGRKSAPTLKLLRDDHQNLQGCIPAWHVPHNLRSSSQPRDDTIPQSCLTFAPENANCPLEFDNSSSARCKIHEAILEL